MAGTIAGGKHAAETNKKKYGENFYRDLALKAQESWRQNGRKPRGFSLDKECASRAGTLGGRISRRTKTLHE
jgi:uncharacterized protein